jgi:uncharacterized protein
MVTDERRFDLPSSDESSQPFWDAAKEGRLLAKRCLTCGEVHFYPRPFCPVCWSTDVEWFEVSGRGTLYTYSVVYQNDLPPFAKRVPYVAAIVDLEEGPRMMTNVVDCPIDELSVGMALEVKFERATDDFTFPVFGPTG